MSVGTARQARIGSPAPSKVVRCVEVRDTRPLLCLGEVRYCSIATVHKSFDVRQTITVNPLAEQLQEVPDLATIDGLTVIQALSDPVRLEIVRQLACCDDPGEIKCGQIQLSVTKSTASHHFKVLREAGVLQCRDEGTRRYHSVRREDLDARFPGLLDAVLRVADESRPPR